METVTIRENGVMAEFEKHTFGQGAPHVFFTAGIHGNEVTGVYVAGRLIDYLHEHPLLYGSVEIIPAVNTTAMRCMQRRCPFDREDLNRIFPGNEHASISHRLAAAVWEQTEQADFLIDLHCCGQHGLPYILSVYSESEKTRALVSRITMPVAVHSEGTGGQLFTESTRKRAQAACVIELPSGAGEGSVNVSVGAGCFEALLDLLRSLGMLTGEVRGNPPAFYGTLLDVTAEKAGLWSPCVARGDTINAGQAIGAVDGVPVRAPAAGMAMGVRPTAYLFADNLWVMTYVEPEQKA